ncbi:MAG: DUF2283 domain-containing protein [Alphaproteobacteria bacterium]|nr:DUF2283 domain-containing protein [Alphaproteobacteria bacterium]
MRAVYDKETDTLTMRLSNAQIVESDEDKPGIIIDYDSQGNIVGLEILDASRRVTDPALMEFSVSVGAS